MELTGPHVQLFPRKLMSSAPTVSTMAVAIGQTSAASLKTQGTLRKSDWHVALGFLQMICLLDRVGYISVLEFNVELTR